MEEETEWKVMDTATGVYGKKDKGGSMDILFIALTVAFFGVTGALINFLGKL